MLIAHRGGSADWPEGTAAAYARAAAWDPGLALEVPVWRTADGLWVVSHDASTARVFGVDRDVRSTGWAELSRLRTTDGGLPMARLVEDVLDVHADRLLLVDDKADADAGDLLDRFDERGGPEHVVLKAHGLSVAAPELARARGYRTWGYWYPAEMDRFAATQQRFDMVAMQWSAPQAVFDVLLATGKPVSAHVVADAEQARTGLARGATGLMVSGVTRVVPHRPAGVRGTGSR